MDINEDEHCLNRTKYLKILEKVKVDICVHTETKKEERGSEEIENYIHHYSGVSKDSRANRGVFVVIGKTSRRTQNVGNQSTNI